MSKRKQKNLKPSKIKRTRIHSPDLTTKNRLQSKYIFLTGHKWIFNKIASKLLILGYCKGCISTANHHYSVYDIAKLISQYCNFSKSYTIHRKKSTQQNSFVIFTAKHAIKKSIPNIVNISFKFLRGIPQRVGVIVMKQTYIQHIIKPLKSTVAYHKEFKLCQPIIYPEITKNKNCIAIYEVRWTYVFHYDEDADDGYVVNVYGVDKRRKMKKKNVNKTNNEIVSGIVGTTEANWSSLNCKVARYQPRVGNIISVCVNTKTKKRHTLSFWYQNQKMKDIQLNVSSKDCCYLPYVETNNVNAALQVMHNKIKL